MAGGEVLRVPAVVVLSGAGIGAGSVRQLLRAVAAGRLETERIVVVDRDPACAASRFRDVRVQVAPADWSEWLDRHLDALGPGDHLVPYHWAPHLLVEWLRRQAERAGARAERGGAVPPHGVPVDRPTRDGDRALSYATWVCPPTCIEPVLCPHTRGPKDWSLARDLEAARPGEGLDGRIVLRCLHLAYGVGTVPVAAIRSARDRVLEGFRGGARRWLVATSSHCHALATVLDVAPLI
ncbi:MAG TPA: hypothetical protein VLI67_12130 [Vicinamibacteria bacterium]|nr:hypothetical protein [Vicinamibacteria bacterium]